MSKTEPRDSEPTGYWSLEFLWSFDIGNLLFASGAGCLALRCIAHPHLDAIVQFAQAAGGDDFARLEAGEDLLSPLVNPADLDRPRASDSVFNHKNPGHAREVVHRIE